MMIKKPFLLSKNGFTFVEILAVLSLLGLILAIGSLQLHTYQKHQKTEQAARSFEKILHLAKERALSGYQPSSGFNGELTGYEIVPDADQNTYRMYAVVDGTRQPSALSSYLLSDSAADIVFANPSDPVLFQTVGQGCNVNGSLGFFSYSIVNEDGYACQLAVTCPTGQIEFQECS